MMTSQSLQWLVAPHAELLWREWDDGVVLLHGLANDTHRLSLASGRLVAWLAANGPDTDEGLAKHFQTDQASIRGMLEELAELDVLTCR